MNKLYWFIPVDGIIGVNLWVLFSLLPIMMTLTATIPEFHRGYLKYITWTVYLTLFLGIVQLNYEIFGLFNMQNIFSLVIYIITAVIGYSIAKDEGK